MNDQQKFIHDNRKLRAMMDVTFTEIYAYIKRGDTTNSEQSTFDERDKEVKDNKKKLGRSGALKPFFDALHEADRQLMSAEGHLRRSREDRFKNDLAVAVTKLRECRRIVMAEKPKHSGKIRTMFDKLEVIMGNLETQARETHTAAEHKVVKDRDMQHVSAIREVVTALRTQVEDYVSSGEEQTWDVGELDRRDKSGKHTLASQLKDFQTKVADTKTALSGRVNWRTVTTSVNQFEADLREMVESAKQLDKNKSHFGERLRAMLDSCEILQIQVGSKNTVLLKTNITEMYNVVRKLVSDIRNDTTDAPLYVKRQSLVNYRSLYDFTNTLFNELNTVPKLNSTRDVPRFKQSIRRCIKASDKIKNTLIRELAHADDHEEKMNISSLLTMFNQSDRSGSSTGAGATSYGSVGWWREDSHLTYANKTEIERRLADWLTNTGAMLDRFRTARDGSAFTNPTTWRGFSW